jgi:large subunit ribosomal protein L25
LHFVGDQVAPGVKLGGGSVSKLMTDVEVSCLPRDLPGYIEVDISHMELDDMLHLSDIKLPEGVEILELQHGEGHDHAIVSVHVLRTASAEEEQPAVEAETGEAGEEAKGEETGGESEAD